MFDAAELADDEPNFVNLFSPDSAERIRKAGTKAVRAFAN
jgi:hypothetical protein